MHISQKTSEIVSDIKSFSGGKLKNENDISLLIELSGSGKNTELFGEIIFTAKYLNGLGKILQTNISSALEAKPDAKGKIDENAEKRIRNEFGQNVIKLTKQISKLISPLRGEERKQFDEKYLAMNRTSLVNLTNLIYDLSWVKQYMNAQKE